MMPKCRENQGPDSGYQSREILNAPTKTKIYWQSHKLLLSSSDTHRYGHNLEDIESLQRLLIPGRIAAERFWEMVCGHLLSTILSILTSGFELVVQSTLSGCQRGMRVFTVVIPPSPMYTQVVNPCNIFLLQTYLLRSCKRLKRKENFWCNENLDYQGRPFIGR